MQNGDGKHAASHASKAVAIDPNAAADYFRMGHAYAAQGDLTSSIRCYQKAVEIKPDFEDAYINLGYVFKLKGRADQAIAAYRNALLINRNNAETYANLGNVFQEQGDFSQATLCYEKAIDINPSCGAFYFNMATVCHKLGELDNAVLNYRKAIEFDFGSASVWFYLGNVYQAQGNIPAALEAYRNAVETDPNYAKAYRKMGNLFKAVGRIDHAIRCYHHALGLEPNMEEAYVQSAEPLQATCSWDGFQGVSKKLDRITTDALKNGKVVNESPFLSIIRHADPSLNYQVATAWSKRIHIPQFQKRSIDNPWDRIRSKIRIGYLSCDFRDHPVSHLITSLIQRHNRNEFEIYAYSLADDDESEYRKQVQRDCHKFIDLKNLGDAEAAKRIGYDQLDILVELMGHTQNSRLGICAYRPAPVQVSYLGYPGTTGAEFIDYLIADRTITPEDHVKYYSENVIFMPDSYMAFDGNQPISNRGFTKAHFNLPKDAFIFCSFNKAHKLEPVMFEIWMRILRKVPLGILWLGNLHPMAIENLRMEAKKRGVDPVRIVFSERMATKSEHLERLGLADLALDTRIYNGHVTTGDALLAGVPVVTLKGTHFASRVSSSLLYAAGLPELVTHSAEEYETLAVTLAQDQRKLMKFRRILKENRLTAPLFDMSQFVMHLECAYKEIHKVFQAENKTRQVSTPSAGAGSKAESSKRKTPVRRIFISSMPRAGSMWTYNVVRELIRAVKLKPIPEYAQTQTDGLIEEALRESPAADEIYCVKTHQLINGHQKNNDTYVIVPYRDVRDSMLSFMRFMHTGFEHALSAAIDWMMMTDEYANQKSDHILMIRYDDIVDKPLKIIEKINGFLSFPNKSTTLEKINAELSRERIKQKIDGLNTLHLDDLLLEGPHLSSVRNMDGSYRVFDRNSGFQSNHITSKKAGEWRQALDSEQKAKLMQATQSWLKKYNFPI